MSATPQGQKREHLVAYSKNVQRNLAVWEFRNVRSFINVCRVGEVCNCWGSCVEVARTILGRTATFAKLGLKFWNV